LPKILLAARIVLAYKVILKKNIIMASTSWGAMLLSAPYPGRPHKKRLISHTILNSQRKLASLIEVSATINFPPLPERFLLGSHHVDDLDAFSGYR
jgi:hypothetical protein